MVRSFRTSLLEKQENNVRGIFFTRKKVTSVRKETVLEAPAWGMNPLQSNCWTKYLLYFIRLALGVSFWAIFHLHRWVAEIRVSVWSVLMNLYYLSALLRALNCNWRSVACALVHMQRESQHCRAFSLLTQGREGWEERAQTRAAVSTTGRWIAKKRRPRSHDSCDSLTLEHDTSWGLMVSITVSYFLQWKSKPSRTWESVSIYPKKVTGRPAVKQQHINLPFLVFLG